MTSCAEGDSPVERTWRAIFRNLGDKTIRQSNLSEKLFERVTANNVNIGFQTRFSERLLKEFRHVQANSE